MDIKTSEETQHGTGSQDEEDDFEDDELLAWCETLDYEQYVAEWNATGSTATGGN